MRPTPRWGRATLIGGVVVVVIGIGYVALGSPLKAAIRGVSHAGPPSASAPGRASNVSIGPPSLSASPPASGYGEAAGGPSGVKMPDQDLPGWKLSFADDFNGKTLGNSWFAYTGEPEGDPGGFFSPNHVAVGHDMLTIGAWQEPEHGNRYVTGGISVLDGLAQKYGRYEVRFKMQLGQGISYALLLWPSTNRSRPEIDFAEDNGRLRDATFMTVHPAAGGKAIGRSVGGDFTQWHTVGMEWSPNLIVFTVDGREWTRVTGDVVPAEPMTLALQSQSWNCGRGWVACPDASTPPRVDLFIDWAVQWAWAG